VAPLLEQNGTWAGEFDRDGDQRKDRSAENQQQRTKHDILGILCHHLPAIERSPENSAGEWRDLMVSRFSVRRIIYGDVNRQGRQAADDACGGIDFGRGQDDGDLVHLALPDELNQVGLFKAALDRPVGPKHPQQSSLAVPSQVRGDPIRCRSVADDHGLRSEKAAGNWPHVHQIKNRSEYKPPSEQIQCYNGQSTYRMKIGSQASRG